MVGSLLTFSTLTAFATNDSLPRKIDSFGAIACDDAMSRLDAFASHLQNEPDALGYIVVYPERNGLPGKYLSYIDFSKYHLEMVRGISVERLRTLRGEYRGNLTTELWIVPSGASLPIRESSDGMHLPFGKFDEGFADYSTYQGKQALWTYDLCPLAAIYFDAFASQLRSKPNSTGRLIIHLEYGKPPSRAGTMAHLLRTEMVTSQHINSQRIVIVYGERRKIPMVELWITPN